MDYIKGLIFSQGSSKGGDGDDGNAGSSSSSSPPLSSDNESSSKGGGGGGGNDNDNIDGAQSSTKTVTFMEAESPSSSDDEGGKGGDNNDGTKSTKGRMMDSMAYLTQPDQDDDESESSDQEEEESSSSSGNKKQHIPLQWNSPDVPSSKGGELWKAREQCGDSSLTQSQPSPGGRQHSSTIIKSKKQSTQSLSASSKEAAVKQSQQPSLSQSVVQSPLRSPSPLTIMSQQTVSTSPLMDNSTTGTGSKLLLSEAGSSNNDSNNNNHNVNRSKELRSKQSHIDNAKNVKQPVPIIKDAIHDDEAANHRTDEKQHDDADDDDDDIIDFGTSSDQYDMDDDNGNNKELKQKKKQQRLVHKMNMKKQAIYRSLLHLSDNSYSFVYNNNDDDDDDNKSSTMNDDDEPGLPYIGPDLKEDYVSLRNMLRKGLLGITNDDDDDDVEVTTNNGESSTKDDDATGGDNDKGSTNPFLPKIKSNVAAVLMGPRGHGKTLVLERCLASLSRLAAKRKERVMEQLMMKQRQQQSSSSSSQQAAEEMYSQASFRVVRLNGLLFQGDSAVTCTREIARQIGVMSREERKRTRRIMKQISTKRKFQRMDDDFETPKASSSKRQRKKDKSSSNIKNSSDQRKTKQSTPAADTPLLPGLTQTPNDNTTPSGNNNESHDLRIRRSGFNTYIALLDEVLRTARIDGIPILIILEELQAFLASGRSSANNMHTDSTSEGGGNTNHHDGGSNDRQLLLYHLLDRVADHKFLVSVVGLTTDLTAVTKLEKRVQSRAEGTSKIIYFGHNKTFDDLVKCLLGKFYTPTPDESNNFEEEEDVYNERSAMIDVREEVNVILSGGKSGSGSNRLSLQEEENDGGEINDCALVQRVLKRNYSLIGSDMRWICRVFDVALSLLVSDIDERIYQCMEDDKEMDDCVDDNTIIPCLSPSHVARALITMNASMDDVVSATVGRPGIPTQGTLELIRWGKLLGDPKHYSCLVGTHPRLVALLDLSGPQVAVLLAARRIEARDDTRANAGEDEIEMRRRRGSTGGSGTTATTTSSTSLPLTYQRIEDEYITSFVASGRYTISSDRYPKHVLYRSCMDLMEMDIIRLKKDICGGGALQYGHNDTLSFGTNMAGLPLFVNLDYELEFMPAVKANLLYCSTALREWGMKMN